MRLAILITAALLLTAVPAAAKKDDRVDFLGNAQFRFGMPQHEADDRFGDPEKPNEDYSILYRVDTPSTAEFGCTYKTRELYLVRFYEGECYFLERRAEILFDEVQEVFEFFTKLYGNTPEATQSRDARLLYARWMLKDRDIELSAHQREGNAYILTYQEFDPLLLGEALHTQESELKNAGTTEVDPLTGRPRMSTHNEPQGEAEEEPGDGDGESEGKDKEEEKEKKDPPPEEDEPDWY